MFNFTVTKKVCKAATNHVERWADESITKSTMRKRESKQELAHWEQSREVAMAFKEQEHAQTMQSLTSTIDAKYLEAVSKY